MYACDISKFMFAKYVTISAVVAPTSKFCYLSTTKLPCLSSHFKLTPGGGGGNAIYMPYGDVPPIRVYFLAFESETGCVFSSLTLKQGAKFVQSLRARSIVHTTVWHPPIGFNLFVFCPGN